MTKPIRVLHFSSHHEDCGVAKYQELFLESMDASTEVENKFFDSSPYKTRVMDQPELDSTMKRLKKELKSFDMLHIQHEFGMYGKNDFQAVIATAKQAGKKVLVTIHLSPGVVQRAEPLGGLGPRSLVHYLKGQVKERRFQQYFAKPLQQADTVIVHNDVTRQDLISIGVQDAVIKKVVIPVPTIVTPPKSTEIHEKLKVTEGDIVYATVGFLHKYKGIHAAVKALRYLPENYKLAIIGGIHITSDHAEIYDDITDLIRDLNLQDRVYITGFIPEDEKLNSLIGEVDICIYPYDKTYYSNVSSASLNNAFANHKPVVAYPTKSFTELANEADNMTLTNAFSYYELAREIVKLDLADAAKKSKKFSDKYSYSITAQQLVDIYKSTA